MESKASGHGDQEILESIAKSSNGAQPDHESLLRDCDELLSEMNSLQSFLRESGNPDAVELRKFRSSVLAERDTLQNIPDNERKAVQSVHTLKSSNLPFYAAVWNVAKRAKHVTALGKRYNSKKPGRNSQARKVAHLPSQKDFVLVDIVAEDGEEWTKVSTTTERRLLFEIAEAGWAEDPPGVDAASRPVGDPQAGAEPEDGDSDRSDEIGVVKAVKELTAATVTNRVRWRAPRLRLVLTRIREGTSTNIDLALARIRSTGAAVQCGGDDPRDESMAAVFRRMLPSVHPGISSSLNLDCTILLALISDISHLHLNPQPSQQSSVRQQISSESTDCLLPSILYPVLSGRPLFSAAKAARRMREIVGALGTQSEKARAEILFGEGASTGATGLELRLELGKWSAHPVPNDLQLPATVVPEGELSDVSDLPLVARELDKSLSRINRSVFLLGWKRGWTTITSNRVAVRSIETILADQPAQDWVGPSFWVCKTARSLLGKEKAR